VEVKHKVDIWHRTTTPFYVHYLPLHSLCIYPYDDLYFSFCWRSSKIFHMQKGQTTFAHLVLRALLHRRPVSLDFHRHYCTYHSLSRIIAKLPSTIICPEAVPLCSTLISSKQNSEREVNVGTDMTATIRVVTRSSRHCRVSIDIHCLSNNNIKLSSVLALSTSLSLTRPSHDNSTPLKSSKSPSQQYVQLLTPAWLETVASAATVKPSNSS
jgi:hypothetical protein